MSRIISHGLAPNMSTSILPIPIAGPLALARDILGKDDSPFFVLNSDVICDFPFKKLKAFHEAHGDEGTIVVGVSKSEAKEKTGNRKSSKTNSLLNLIWEGSQISLSLFLF